MSADKRSVSTDALQTLGTLTLDQDAGRDAIHIAVEAITSNEKLFPGQHIGIVDGQASSTATKMLGIVDPYLPNFVPPGTKFWLLVYPRQITSLRHVWEHPDFEEKIKQSSSTKSYSEKWMMNWAIKHMSYDYYGDGDSLPNETAYGKAIEVGKNNHIGPYEGARDYINDEWWNHWELITGLKGDREQYFSCSC